jgi:hypothetical protein
MLVRHPLLTTLIVVGMTASYAFVVKSGDLNPNPGPAPLFAAAQGGAPSAPASLAQPLTAPLSLATPMADVNRAAPAPRQTEKTGGPAAPFVLVTAPPSPSGGTSAETIDLSALRYFASQNDLSRVAAEIRLIRLKHPDWEPPEDLFSGGGQTAEEGPLWTLFSNQDYDGVRAGIERIQEGNPDWRPSSDLANKLALAEAYRDIVRASNASDWADVVQIAAQNKMLLTCDYVDALWRTAEALVHLDDEGRATEAYRYILSNCRKPQERLATAEKASLLLRNPEAFNELMLLGHPLSDGRNEFESIKLDRLRKTIGDSEADPQAPPPSEADLDLLARRAHASANAQDDQQLLAWYFYSHKDYAQAETWFRAANQPIAIGKVSEGLVLSLRDAGKLDDARKAALQFAPLGPLNQKIMLEIVASTLDNPKTSSMSTEERAAFVKAIDDQKDSDAAQIYGWSLYNANDIAGAKTWFEKSASWGVTESAAVGLVVTARKLGDAAGYGQAVAKYRTTYAKVAQFEAAMTKYSVVVVRGRKQRVGSGWDRSAEAIVQQLQAGKYDATLAMLDARLQTKRAEPPGLLVVRGWALYHQGDWNGAKQVFEQVAAKGLSRQAQEGLDAIEASTRTRYTR